MRTLLTKHGGRGIAVPLAGCYLLPAFFWQNLQFNDESNYLDAGSHLHTSS